MERVIDLTEIVAHEVAGYVTLGVDGADTYLLNDDAHHIYGAVTVPHTDPQDSLVVVLAQITAESMVIILTDRTDKPLYDALLQAGVPRSRTVKCAKPSIIRVRPRSASDVRAGRRS